MVVRKGTVTLAIEALGLREEPLEQGGGHKGARTVPAVDDDAGRASELSDPLDDVIDVSFDDRLVPNGARAVREDAACREPIELLNSFAVNGLFADTDLESVVLRWIVRAGDLNARANVEMRETPIQKRR